VILDTPVPVTISARGTVSLPKALIDKARAESADGTAKFTLVYPNRERGAGRLLVFTPAEFEALSDRVKAMPRGSLERAAVETLFFRKATQLSARYRTLRLPKMLADLFAPLPCEVILKQGKTGLDLYVTSRDTA